MDYDEFQELKCAYEHRIDENDYLRKQEKETPTKEFTVR